MPGSTYTLRQRSSGKGDSAPPSSRYSIRCTSEPAQEHRMGDIAGKVARGCKGTSLSSICVPQLPRAWACTLQAAQCCGRTARPAAHMAHKRLTRGSLCHFEVRLGCVGPKVGSDAGLQLQAEQMGVQNMSAQRASHEEHCKQQARFGAPRISSACHKKPRTICGAAAITACCGHAVQCAVVWHSTAC